jgi:hypothetical protein
MKKSDELNELKELPKVDYSKLPEVTAEAIAEKPFIIKEKAKLTWDGKQLLVRIPSEIAKELGITKENQMLFILTKPLPNSSDKPKLEIELI